MTFEWDEAKNRANIAKHGLSFQLARLIFEGFTVDAPDTRADYGEVRTICVGRLGDAVVLVVVHTDRKGVCRIISARQANRKERALYEQTLRKAFDS